MGSGLKIALCSCALFGLLVGAVHATPILPGQSAIANPETEPTTGTIVGTPLVMPFVAGTFSGTLTSVVIAGDLSNPWGGLTFVYQLSNNDYSPDAIHRITLNSYQGFQTDASYLPQQGTQPPTTVDRSLNGDVIGFGFLGAPLGFGGLNPGAVSAPLVVQTDAQFFQETFASIIDGTVTTVGTYSPSPVVPEPVTLSLLTAGFGLVFVRRR